MRSNPIKQGLTARLAYLDIHYQHLHPLTDKSEGEELQTAFYGNPWTQGGKPHEIYITLVARSMHQKIKK